MGLLWRFWNKNSQPESVLKKIRHCLMLWSPCWSTKFNTCTWQWTNNAFGYLTTTHFCNPLNCPLITLAPSYVCPTSFSPIPYCSTICSAWFISPAAVRSALTSVKPTNLSKTSPLCTYVLTVASWDFFAMSDVSSRIIETKLASLIPYLMKSSTTFAIVLIRSFWIAGEVPLIWTL